MNSIWTETAERPQFEKLEHDVKTDVLIIGGGITGILCAYILKRAGVDCILAEADSICSGITRNTTAKITCQHGLIYSETARRFGYETARLYLEAQLAAMSEYRRLCTAIACDYEELPSYVYSLDDRRKIEREVETLNRIGVPAKFTKNIHLPFSVAGAVRIDKQAQFNPLKLAFGIAKELSIYENTKIIELRPDGAITDRGKIASERIIVATHFPFLNKHGSYFLKMYQHRSYVLALKNAPNVNGMYVDENETGMSFRNYNGLLFVGGGSHRTGKSGGNWNVLEEFYKKNYPDAKPVCRWATQDCMTLDGIPYIGQYSRRTENMYVATGFNKWGMTSAMVAAMLLTDLMKGKATPYASVFSPSRSILRPQLAINTVEALGGLLRPTAPRCPHMGCALKYNKQEHSWDCSCHGSRFSENGSLIDNPATDGKKAMPSP
ncbi:MAG: FAD-dependent oxidoreductase [Clostridia bacterium]|nr:FAD-dependent oxidoreductase [Clostridia bacterium]